MFPQEVWSFESDEGCTDEQREDSQTKTRGEFPDSRMDYKVNTCNWTALGVFYKKSYPELAQMDAFMKGLQKTKHAN